MPDRRPAWFAVDRTGSTTGRRVAGAASLADRRSRPARACDTRRSWRARVHGSRYVSPITTKIPTVAACCPATTVCQTAMPATTNRIRQANPISGNQVMLWANAPTKAASSCHGQVNHS